MVNQLDFLRIGTAQRFILGTALLLMGLLLVPSAQAQGPGGMNRSPDERATARITLLTEQVQLTAAQATQLKPILVKQFTEQSALFQKFADGGDRAAMRTEMQAQRTKNDTEILAVLTDAQKTSYRTLMEEEATRRANRGGGGGGQ